ncbi:unnamed protein product [Schistosoma rodhaini]|uniref:Uncharacterized protein n=1 Tax=Schistosoma rodhaini TaxID=6188 RepID=A0AA85FUS1_9TREM|nr:unnamed protein product [Schistosoma rodhaini]
MMFNDDINAAISEYGKLYAVNIQIRYKLLIMALKSDINLTLEESYTCMTMLQQKGDRNWDDNIQKKIEYVQWLAGSDKNSQSRYITDRAKAEVNCISTTREYFELQRVKDTPNSKTQANQFDKINKNFNSSLGELKSKVEGLEINRINYLRYKNPMERVTAVLKAMEEEVDHEYVPSY